MKGEVRNGNASVPWKAAAQLKDLTPKQALLKGHLMLPLGLTASVLAIF